MNKILLVEDNKMNRDMLTSRLERKGFGGLPGCSEVGRRDSTANRLSFLDPSEALMLFA